MNKLQLLLGKLTEECCEVGQSALKTSQFGLDGTIPGTNLTNRDRLNAELNDVIAVIEMLNEEFQLQYSYDINEIRAKKEKITKYALISEDLGFVEWTNS